MSDPIVRHRNGWLPRSAFDRVMEAIAVNADQLTFLHVSEWSCKYMEVRVDMRTGDFIIKNNHGDVVSDEIIERVLGIKVTSCQPT